MQAYHKIALYSLLFAAGLATASPIRSGARVIDTHAAQIERGEHPITKRDYRGDSANYRSNHDSIFQTPESDECKICSLEYLISNASHIFAGYAKRVRHSMFARSPDEASIQVRTVTFVLKHILKGEGIVENTEYTVRQRTPWTLSIGEGEQLLLYLMEPAEGGFQYAVGDHMVGHFFVLPDRTNPNQYVAVNLNNNTGLWGRDSPLWNENTFPENAAAEYLAKIHKPPIPPSRQKMILDLGRQGIGDTTQPLELILAGTHAGLSKLPHR